jgi:hypothetical protein
MVSSMTVETSAASVCWKWGSELKLSIRVGLVLVSDLGTL